MRALFLLYYTIVQVTIVYGINRYLGCFIDRIDNRDLQILINNEQLTPTECFIACREKNLPYAAIQYGSECRCGDKYGKYGQVSDDECIYSCETSEKCGGDNRNSIYNVIELSDVSKTDPICLNTIIGYQGCFDRITLTVKMNSVHTIDECISHCSTKYNYAGIINGNLCYCGNDLNQPARDRLLCNIPCNRSLNDITLDCCGGLDVLSVYDVNNYQFPVADGLSKTNIRVKRADGDSTSIVGLATSYTVVTNSTPLITSGVPSSINVTTPSTNGSFNVGLTSMGLTNTSTIVPINTNAASTLTVTNTTTLSTIQSTSSNYQQVTNLTSTTTLPNATMSIGALSTGVSTSFHTDSLQVTSSSTTTTTTVSTAPSPQSTSHIDTSISQTSSPALTSGAFTSTLHVDTSRITSIATSSTIATTQASSIIFTSQSTPTVSISSSTHIETASMTSVTTTLIAYTSPLTTRTDLSQATSTSIFSSLHTDTTQTRISTGMSSVITQTFSPLTIISSSLPHTDTSQGTTIGTSTTVHTDTSQTLSSTFSSTASTILTSLLTTAMSSTLHTDTSITSVSSSSLRTDTSSILGSTGMSASVTYLTTASSSTMLTNTVSSSTLHTDTSQTFSSNPISTYTATFVSLLTGASTSTLHTDSSTMLTNTVSSSTLHTDTSQTFSSNPTSTYTATFVSLLTGTSTSTLHTDTSVPSASSSSLHTDTTQTIPTITVSTVSVLSTLPITSSSYSSAYTGVSYVTSTGTLSSPHTDTSQTISSSTAYTSTITSTLPLTVTSSSISVTSTLFSSPHTDTTQTVASTFVNTATTASVSLMTATSSSILHVDTSSTLVNTVSSSSLHTDTSQTTGTSTMNSASITPTLSITLTSYSSPAHTDASVTSAASSSLHTDTTQTLGTIISMPPITLTSYSSPAHTDASITSAASSSLHTDTTQTLGTITSMPPITLTSYSSPAHTDASVTSAVSSSLHTDTTQTLGTITSMPPITLTSYSSPAHTDTSGTVGSSTVYTASMPSNPSIITDHSTSVHTDTTVTFGSITSALLSSSSSLNTVSIMSTTSHTDTSQSITSPGSSTLMTIGSGTSSSILSTQSVPTYTSYSAATVSGGSSIAMGTYTASSNQFSSSGATLTQSSSTMISTMHSDTSATLGSSTSNVIQTGSSSIATISTGASSGQTQTMTMPVSSSLHTDTSIPITVSTPSFITTASISLPFTSSVTSSSSTPSVTIASSASSIIAAITSQTSTMFSSSVSTTTTTSQTIVATLTSNSITSVTNSTIVTLPSSTNSSTTIASTTASLTTTTTPTPTNLIFTVIRVFNTQIFNPNNATQIEEIRRGIQQIITLGYQCLSDPSNSQCSISGRRKRQACSLYNVTIIPPITLISSNTSNPLLYMVNYTVTDGCTNTQLSASSVKVATDKVPDNQKSAFLRFTFDGNFVQSPSIKNETPTSTPDNKLWIIGAVLGPVAFVLLLIGLCCFLYYKCRPRKYHGSIAQAVYNAPNTTARIQNYQTIPDESMKEQATPIHNIRVLPMNDPFVGGFASAQRLPPIELQKTSNYIPQYPASVDIPMQEIRRQNDVDRWRNKLRLQEKFEQRYADPLTDLDRLHTVSAPKRITPPMTNRSIPYQYDQRPAESDLSNTHIRPMNEIEMYETAFPVRRTPPLPEIEAGRIQLHRLLDEVLDKVEPDEIYNPDSDAARRTQRRQRRRVHSAAYDPQNLYVINDNQQMPHLPIIPRITDRQNSSLLSVHYNPYEAGDRAHEIERLTPVELKLKYASDDNDIQRYVQPSYRSNPPLYHDDSVLINRPIMSPNAYNVPKRQARIHPEGSLETMMRHNPQRHRRFDEDDVLVDTISRNPNKPQIQVPNAWKNREEDNDGLFQLNPSDLDMNPTTPNDFHDEYMIAKQSVVNTKNLISSIQNELQSIVSDPLSDNYHA